MPWLHRANPAPPLVIPAPRVPLVPIPELTEPALGPEFMVKGIPLTMGVPHELHFRGVALHRLLPVSLVWGGGADWGSRGRGHAGVGMPGVGSTHELEGARGRVSVGAGGTAMIVNNVRGGGGGGGRSGSAYCASIPPPPFQTEAHFGTEVF